MQPNSLIKKDSFKFKNNILSYLIVYLCIGSSGIFIFPGHKVLFVSIFLFTFVLYLANNRFNSDNDLKNKKFLTFIAIITILLIGQSLKFSTATIEGVSGLYIYFLMPFFILKLVRDKFIGIYIRIISFFTILSFLFYFPSIIFPDFFQFLKEIPTYLGTNKGITRDTFVIYTVMDWLNDGYIRNAGPFNEPGTFASMSIIALMLNTVATKTLFEKKNVVITLGILTSLSTAGYVALILFLTSFYLFNRKKLKKIILPLFILILGYYAYLELPFLENKIVHHYTTQSEMGYNSESRGRFFSARLDMIDVKNNFLFGRGLIKQTRFNEIDFENPNAIHRTNGLTDLMVKLGVFGFLIYFLFLFKTIERYVSNNNFNKKFSVYILFTIMVVGFAQIIFITPVLISLVYYSFFDFSKKKLKLYDRPF